MNKNAYRLTGRLKKNGYDWWWHSFVGIHEKTGQYQPFFIEYYVVNPRRWNGKVVFGQHNLTQSLRKRPCYAMIKAGAWGKKKCQLHAFFGIDSFKASRKKFECHIGENYADESFLKGSISISKETATQHPEQMTDSGTMQWDLNVIKEVSFDVGYGTSQVLNRLHAFNMYWHVQGMRCRYSGTVELNGERYKVEPQTSFGYQDKIWGSDFTNPWIWLNCNNFTTSDTQQPVNASLVVGGGCPVVFGIPLKRRILTALYYNGDFFEFNFSKFWKRSRQNFSARSNDTHIFWRIEASNRDIALEIDFSCPKGDMLWVNYENPKGIKNHTELWNGGHDSGTVKLFKLKPVKQLIDTLHGQLGGCEYGEY